MKQGQRFRLGGMVVKGSVQRQSGSLDVKFTVTDFAHTVPVTEFFAPENMQKIFAATPRATTAS